MTYADIVWVQRFDNGVGRCSTMTQALCQFDFTANAIAVDLRTRRLLDPLGGVADCRGGLMKAVRLDFPDEPISLTSEITRPAVLWFRLVHYAGAKGLLFDATTLSWVLSNLHFVKLAYLFQRTFFPLHHSWERVLWEP